MADYRNPVDVANAQRSPLDTLSELSKMFQQKQMQEQAEQAALEKQKQEHQLREQGAQNRISQVEEMHAKYPNLPISMSAEGASMGSSQDQDNLMRMLQLMATMEDREDRKVERLQDDVTKSGAPQAAESIHRVNKAIPGAFTGQAKFKSVGGIKNLAPNFSVPILEKMGVMDPGASDERAALQEAQNAKIYDSSGKQINEAEMQRIKDAMGMRGMFDPSAINQSLQQVGQTVLRKNENITSGYKPGTVNTFHQRGGVTPVDLKSMLSVPGAAPQSPAPVQPSVDPEEAEYLRLKQKHGR